MSWLVSYALSIAIGYVVVDVLLGTVVLARGRDLEWDLVVPRPVALVIAALVLSEAVLLLVAAVVVATRWPALAVFPVLGACWVGADVPALVPATARGRDAYRVRTTSPLMVVLGTCLAACLFAVGLVVARLRP